MDNKIKQWSWN